MKGSEHSLTYYIFLAYLFFLVSTVLIGVFRYRLFDPGSKIVFWLLAITGFTESCNFFIRNRNPLYHVYALVLMIFITCYFFRTVASRNRLKYTIVLSSLWLVISLINTLFLQDINSINSNIILLYSYVIIAMSLYSLYRILLNDAIHNVLVYPHFSFWALLLLLWSGTFFFWIYIRVPTKAPKLHINLFQNIAGFINLVSYAGFGLIFLFYPKMAKTLGNQPDT